MASPTFINYKFPIIHATNMNVFIYGLPTDKTSPVIWFFPVHKYRSAFLLF